MTFALQKLTLVLLNLPLQVLECTSVRISKAKPPVNTITISMNIEILSSISGDFNFDLIESPPHKILHVKNQHISIPKTDCGSLFDHVCSNKRNLRVREKDIN